MKHKSESIGYEPEQPTQNLSTSDLEEQIRLRAYEIHEERGDGPGHPVSDWLQAEEEVLASGSDTAFKAAA